MKHLFLSVFCFFVTACSLHANNLQIQNVTATTSSVTFDISWDNSWNIQNLSRDAVWIFLKYQDCSSSNKSWSHLDLNLSSHSITGNLLQVDAASDGKGVFIRRSAFGGGNNATTQVTLVFATSFTSLASVNFDVVGIEMVYVPQGSFYANDGTSTSSDRFGNNGNPGVRLISSDSAIIANGLSQAGGSSGLTTHLRHPAILDNFPKGFGAFYCMKYEITQGQYVHFLNSLPASQQSIRTQTAVTSEAPSNIFAMHDGSAGAIRRNHIKIVTASTGNPMTPAVFGLDYNNNQIYNEPGDGMNIACNYLNWGDLLAYLTLTGLL